MLIEAGPFKVRIGAVVVVKEVAGVDCCALDPDDEIELAEGLVAIVVEEAAAEGDVEETVLAPMQT